MLTLYPFSRGFAFVLFEGPTAPYDWGVKEVKEKNKSVKMLADIKELIERYHPAVMVIEETGAGLHRRTSRIRKLYRMLARFSASEYIDLHRMPQKMVKEYFATCSAHTKYDIAKAICRELRGFSHRMPRIRKPWMSADPRQSLFDAAALGLVFYKRKGVPSPYDGVRD